MGMKGFVDLGLIPSISINIYNFFRKIFMSSKRRYGKPRTEAERKARHKRLHGSSKLPPRGTGKKK